MKRKYNLLACLHLTFCSCGKLNVFSFQIFHPFLNWNLVVILDVCSAQLLSQADGIHGKWTLGLLSAWRSVYPSASIIFRWTSSIENLTWLTGPANQWARAIELEANHFKSNQKDNYWYEKIIVYSSFH